MAGSRSGAAETDHSCTIAILWSGRASIFDTLDALLPQLGKQDEVLIVRTVPDSNLPALPGAEEQVRVVEFLEPVFDFGRARNFAVQQARGTLVAFTDDDCIPEPNWLVQMRNELVGDNYSALGGACLPAREDRYPWWWSPDLAWAIGMSTPGFLRGEAWHYPATSNIGAWREVLLKYPFQERPRDAADHLYASGGEDREWWRTLRVNGVYVGTRRDIVVKHNIPQERIAFGYVLGRMQADGVSYWRRQPGERVARHVAAEYVNAQSQLVRAVLKLRAAEAVRAYLWVRRNGAAVAEATHAGKLPCGVVRKLQLAAVRELAADGYYAIRQLVRPKQPLPQNPARMFISALTYLGDTVLLRPVIRALAEALPHSRIDVVAAYPQLLADLPANATVIPSADEAAVQRAARDCDVAVVPYYAKGSTALWRRELAHKAVTFDCEVGFTRRDYLLAALTVSKPIYEMYGLRQPRFPWGWPHELDHLQRLFETVAPLPERLCYSPFDFSGGAHEARRQVPFAEQPFLLIQLTSGWTEKDWPLDRWAALANQLATQYNFNFVFLGDAEARSTITPMLQITEERYCSIDDKLSIPALGWLITRARMLIGPCSGPKHIAFAQRTPTFTLYGPTHPERWGAREKDDWKLHQYERATLYPIVPEEALDLPPKHLISLIEVDDVVEDITIHIENTEQYAQCENRETFEFPDDDI